MGMNGHMMTETESCLFEGLEVVIVGAGPAGLTAGYLLTKAGKEGVVILEADPTYVGGISRTENYKGYLFDIGGHRFFSKSAEVDALWNEIMPDDFIERPRLSRIYYKAKFYSYPLRAFEALMNLGIFESVLCVLSYVKARLFLVKVPTNFHQWVANQFGERLYRIFFKTYTEKVWGMGCDDLSADWAAQRIKGLNLLTAVLRALAKSLGLGGGDSEDKAKVVKTLIGHFRYPRKGPGMMWQKARDKFQAQGGTVHMGTTARAFVWDQTTRLWQVTAVDAQGQTRVYQTRHVISSAPLRDVVNAVSPRPQCASAAATLRYRDFITVAIILKKRPAFTDNWIYIHEPGVQVGRVQNFTSWSPEMVADPEAGCLGLEYFCFEGDSLWTMSDEALIALAVKELEILKLIDAKMVADGHVVRQKKAYPVYDDTYKATIESVRTEFDKDYPHMHFVGRNGMHKYNNQDHAMMTAMLTTRNILGGNTLFDVWAVNEDAEYHEEKIA